MDETNAPKTPEPAAKQDIEMQEQDGGRKDTTENMSWLEKSIAGSPSTRLGPEELKWAKKREEAILQRHAAHKVPCQPVPRPTGDGRATSTTSTTRWTFTTSTTRTSTWIRTSDTNRPSGTRWPRNRPARTGGQPWTDLFYDLFMVAACNKIVKIFTFYGYDTTDGPQSFQDLQHFVCALACWLAVYNLWSQFNAYLLHFQSGHNPDKTHQLFYYFQMICLLVICVNMFYYSYVDLDITCYSDGTVHRRAGGSDELMCVNFAGAGVGAALFLAHGGLAVACLHHAAWMWWEGRKPSQEAVDDAVETLNAQGYTEEAEQVKQQLGHLPSDGSDRQKRIASAAVTVWDIAERILHEDGNECCALKVIGLIPRYGTQYILFILVGPVLINVACAIAGMVHWQMIGKNKATDVAILYSCSWGFSCLCFVALMYLLPFKNQHDLSPGEEAIIGGKKLHHSHCNDHHHSDDVKEFFLRAEGHHAPPIHTEYRTARLKGLACIVWGETILQLTGTGVTTEFVDEWESYFCLLPALFTAILFAKTYYEQVPDDIEDHALNGNVFRAVMWNVFLHPFYFFCCLCYGGGIETIFATLQKNYTPAWKGRIVYGSMAGVIWFSTLILICHTDAQRFRRKVPLKWVGTQLGRLAIGGVVFSMMWWEVWDVGYVKEHPYFNGIICLFVGLGWYFYNFTISWLSQQAVKHEVGLIKKTDGNKDFKYGAGKPAPTMGKEIENPLAEKNAAAAEDHAIGL